MSSTTTAPQDNAEATGLLRLVGSPVRRAIQAIEQNNIDCIRQLLESPGASIRRGSLVLEQAAERAADLLVLALELGRREIAELLLDHRVGLAGTNDDCATCLMLSARHNQLACLDRLLAMDPLGQTVDATDLFGWTALMYACYYGHAEAARRLLLAGASANNCDNDQMTSLIWASGRGFADCVAALLQLGRAKVNQVDKCGTSALVWACRKGHTEVASCLLKAGANVDAVGVFGWSPLLVAIQGDHIGTLKLLLEHRPNINTCDVNRHTPLIAASKEGKLKMVRLLLKARAFVNLSDDYGHTALIHAAKGAHLEVVDLLLKHHADIDHVGADKKSALFWAVEKGNLNIVERLLQSRPNLEMTTKDGETCLMKAVKSRKAGIVRVLLAHQARASTTDKNGDTVLHIAVRIQSVTLAQLILANPKNHHLLHKANRAKQTPIMLDSDNSMPVFPTLLEMQTASLRNNNNNLKISNMNLTDAPYKGSDFHLANPSLDLSSTTLDDTNQPSTALIKKLTTALNQQHVHPKARQQVLA